MPHKRKPAFVFLKNQAYRARVPGAAAGEATSQSEWLNILCALTSAAAAGIKINLDELLHWSTVWSWCQEPFFDPIASDPTYNSNAIPPLPLVRPQKSPSHRLVCGCSSPDCTLTAAASTRGSYIGWRPILEPVNPETLIPDTKRWADLQDGESLPLGTLYMNDQPVPIPQKPKADGDIPDYIPGADMRIGRTHDDPAYQLRMIKIGNLFICDRNIMKNISWNDLDRCGLIYGEQTRAKPPKIPKQPQALKTPKNLTSLLNNLPFSKLK